MASSSIDIMNLRLYQRFCTCGRIASMCIVRTNANGNKGRVYFVCPRKYVSTCYINESVTFYKFHLSFID